METDRELRETLGKLVALVVLVAVAAPVLYFGFLTTPSVGDVCYEGAETEGSGENAQQQPPEFEVHHSTVWIGAEVTLTVNGTDASHTWQHGPSPSAESEADASPGEYVGREYVATVSDNGETARKTGTLRECSAIGQ